MLVTMNIGLDFGGVMDHDPDSWIKTIKKLITNGHEVFIVSHAHSGQDELRRKNLADQSGAINLSFSDTMDEKIIGQRKANLVQEYKIELFVDDYFSRCWAVYRLNPDCGFICLHYSNQGITRKLIEGLCENP